MGFDAWFFARLDQADKAQRLENSEMEFIWRPFFQHNGLRNQIFTHALYQHYSAPDGFNWDDLGWDDPMEDDKTLTTYNVDEKIDDFY